MWPLAKCVGDFMLLLSDSRSGFSQGTEVPGKCPFNSTGLLLPVGNVGLAWIAFLYVRRDLGRFWATHHPIKHCLLTCRGFFHPCLGLVLQVGSKPNRRRERVTSWPGTWELTPCWLGCFSRGSRASPEEQEDSPILGQLKWGCKARDSV